MFKTDWFLIVMIVLSLGATVGFFGYVGYSDYHRYDACKAACATDPIKECYDTRAVCVGEDKIYIKAFK